MSRGTAALDETTHLLVRDDLKAESLEVETVDPLRARAKYLTATPASAISDVAEGLESRRLSREIARTTDEKEVEKLLGRHGELVERMFLYKEQWTAENECELAMVRWKLDRIRDATIGEELDRLEVLVGIAEKTGKRVEEFVAQAKKLTQR